MPQQRDIKAEIAGREGEVLGALGISWPPPGRKTHRQCPWADKSGHKNGDKNPSWRWDERKAKWFCSCGHGDVVDAVQWMLSYDFAEAAQFIRETLGLAPSSGVEHRPTPVSKSEAKIADSLRDDDKDQAGRKRAALRLWREAVPIEDTIAERYLLNIRGVAIPPAGAEAIRFHPRCYHGPTGYHWPAMIALMTDPATGEPGGVHRTFLDPDDADKAEIEPVKMMLGNAGVVRLCADEDVTQGLGISEGIETGLAVIRRGWTPVWAALTAGGIQRFPALPGIDVLSIFTDADDAGLKAARECAATWNAAGREVRAIRPNTEGKDWAA